MNKGKSYQNQWTVTMEYGRRGLPGGSLNFRATLVWSPVMCPAPERPADLGGVLVGGGKSQLLLFDILLVLDPIVAPGKRRALGRSVDSKKVAQRGPTVLRLPLKKLPSFAKLAYEL